MITYIHRVKTGFGICLLLIAITFAAHAGNIRHMPAEMRDNLVVETTRGNNIAFLEMFFKNIEEVHSIIVSHSTKPEDGYTFIRKVWGVDIVHSETNRFVIMDTELTELNNPTFYRIELIKKDGTTEIFYATLPGVE